MEWTEGRRILARMVKLAGRIEGKTVFAKMVCYLEKERGQKIPYSFDSGFDHGHYSMDFHGDLAELVKNGFIIESGIKADSGTKFVYTPGRKLLDAKIELSRQMEKSIVSVLSQYKRYSSSDIEQYDHDVYRDKTKTNSAREIRALRTEQMKKLMKEAKGNEAKAFDLFWAQI